MGDNGITVLVVEDEVFIRMSIVQSLEDDGFEVLEASNADDAIGLLDVHPEVRLMFTGIDMPGSMDSLKLADAVRDRWPPVKIIVTSGHRAMSDDTLPVVGRFFSKPHDPSRITDAIRQMI
jgi:DNA-binding NtrC family response regulator